jgi:nitrogenase iron protein NifH
LICNSREVRNEREAVAAVAERLGVTSVGFIPRHQLVRDCENAGMTVVEGAPSSPMADEYRRLARSMMENVRRSVPQPLDPSDLRSLLKEMTAE